LERQRHALTPPADQSDDNPAELRDDRLKPERRFVAHPSVSQVKPTLEPSAPSLTPMML
jgi:hypothetical protein